MNYLKCILKTVLLNLFALSAVFSLIMPIEIKAQDISITDIYPPSGSRQGKQQVTITGSGFGSEMGTVTFGGSNAEKIIDWDSSGEKIECVTPSYDFEKEVLVEVTHKNGQKASGEYEFVRPLKISSVEPRQGVSNGGDLITINAMADFNFGSDKGSVTFDGKEAEIDSWNENEIKCYTPSHDTGFVNLVVTATNWASDTYSFEYIPGENDFYISSVSPSSGLIKGGINITIRGNKFGESQGTVMFGNQQATCSTWTDSQIVCTAPSSTTPEHVDITVYDTNRENSYSYSQGFEYVINADVVLGISPQVISESETSSIDITVSVSPVIGTETKLPITVPDENKYDFKELPSEITIPANQETATVKFYTNDDAQCEGAENVTFSLELNDDMVSSQNSSLLIVKDDDICVGENQTYKTIQSAIDAAATDDVINVYNGTYNENIVVDKTVTIKAAGSGAIIAGKENHPVVEIKSDNVTLDGFTIYHTRDDYFRAGIYLLFADNCKITGNKLGTDADSIFTGISASNSNNNEISDNSFGLNTSKSINLSASHYNIISGNKFVPCNIYQLWMDSSSHNIISDNIFDTDNKTENNSLSSITLDYSYYNVISDNKDIRLIDLYLSFYNSARNNTVNHLYRGFELVKSDSNDFSRNHLISYHEEINNVYASSSSSNSFYRNIFESDSGGISMLMSEDNMFYFNDISGTVVSNYPPSFNIWSMPTAYYQYRDNNFSNPVRMPGNYHVSNPNKTDSDGDGIADAVYTLPDKEPEDYYPLVSASANYTLDVRWLNSDNVIYEDGTDLMFTEQSLNNLRDDMGKKGTLSETVDSVISILEQYRDSGYKNDELKNIIENNQQVAQYKWLILKHAVTLIPELVAVKGGTSEIWFADQAEQGDKSYSSFAGQILFTSPPANGEIKVDIGTATTEWNFSDFTPGVIDKTFGDGNSKILTFDVRTENAFTVPSDKKLAIRIANTNTDNNSSYEVLTGGTWSYITLSPLSSTTTVNFSSSTQSPVSEGDTVTVKIEMNSVSDSAVTVPFTITGVETDDYTISGAAENGGSYSVTINPGEKEKEITINLKSDNTCGEGDENIILAMGEVTNAVKGNDTTLEFAVTDADGTCVINFEPALKIASESESVHNVNVKIVSEPDSQEASESVSELPITVPFTVSGTATDKKDYSLSVSNNEVTIPAGNTTGTIKITVTDDNICENEENITLSIGDVSNAVKGNNNEHMLTIQDNDTCNVIFESNPQTVSEEESVHVVNVKIDSNMVSESTITVPFTVSGTATDEEDYSLSASNNEVTIPAENTTGNIAINVTDDNICEGEESITLAIGDADEVNNNVYMLTIQDNDTCTVIFESDSQEVSERESDVSVGLKTDSGAVSESPITVPFTVSGTAGNGTDYYLADGESIIESGSATGNISFNVINDSELCEVPETVVLTLTDNNSVHHTVNIKESKCPGDTNSDSIIDLADAVAALKVLVNLETSANGETADVNGDKRIGSEEAVYVLQEVSEVTQPAAGFTIELTEPDPDTGKLITTEDKGTASFTVRLNSKPSADVKVKVWSSDESEGTVDKSELIFTQNNWEEPQTVTVTGVEDYMVDGDTEYEITLEAVSADTNYNGLDPDDVSVINKDNNEYIKDMIDTSRIPESLTTYEYKYPSVTPVLYISLNKQPKGKVTVQVSSSDPGEGVVGIGGSYSENIELTFEPDNWSGRTVYVAGKNDSEVDGDQKYFISLEASSDVPEYIDGTIEEIPALNTDDDKITLNPSSGTGGTEVTITGTDNIGTGKIFGNEEGEIFFGDNKAEINSWSINKIICVTPDGTGNTELKIIRKDETNACELGLCPSFEYTP